MSNKRRPARPAPRPKPPMPAYPKLPPKASRQLHYRGDLTAGIVGQVVGPNTFGERLTVVDATYDLARDLTTAGLAYGIHAAPVKLGGLALPPAT